MEMLLQAGWLGLLLISIAEAAFLPFISPEWILIPLVLAKPEMAVPYAALAVFGTLVGAMLGYRIGSKAGLPLLRHFMTDTKVEMIRHTLERYGIWGDIIAALTPLPFKLFTITSGTFHMRRSTLLSGTFIGRALRFGVIVELAKRLQGFHLPTNLEDDCLVGMLAVVFVMAVCSYLRSEKSKQVRTRVTQLVQMVCRVIRFPMRTGSRSGLTFLSIATFCHLCIALLAGDATVNMFRQTPFLGSVVALLLWLLGCLSARSVYRFMEESRTERAVQAG